MKKNQIIVTASDLREFMSEENYKKFFHKICDGLKVNYDVGFWLIAEETCCGGESGGL